MNNSLNLLLILLGGIFTNCEAEFGQNADGRIHVITQGVTDIDETMAIAHGEVKFEGKSLPDEYDVVSKGLIFGTDTSSLRIKTHKYNSDNYNYNYNCFQTYTYTAISSNAYVINIGFLQQDGFREIGGKGFFDCYLINLLRGNKYYVRAFAHISNDWGDKGENDKEIFNKYVYGDITEFISGGITQDPTIFIPIYSLGIGVMKEDLEGEYDAMRMPQLGYPDINHLEFGGYSDWRLPKLSELNDIYKLRVQIGGFQKNDYWSGDFYDDIFYNYVNFNDGSVGSKVSLKGALVRLVRPLP